MVGVVGSTERQVAAKRRLARDSELATEESEMSIPKRQLHLNAFLHSCDHPEAACKVTVTEPLPEYNIDNLVELARMRSGRSSNRSFSPTIRAWRTTASIGRRTRWSRRFPGGDGGRDTASRSRTVGTRAAAWTKPSPSPESGALPNAPEENP
jgi:hypothetical protein